MYIKNWMSCDQVLNTNLGIMRGVFIVQKRIYGPVKHLWWSFLTKIALREKYLYSELFWSAFSRSRPEYGEIRSFRHFLRSAVNGF